MKRILNLILLMYFTIFSFSQVEDDVYYRPSKKVKKIVTVENTQDTVEYNYTYTYRIKNFNRHNIEYIYIDNYYIYPYYGRYNNIYGRYNIYSSYYYNFIYPYYHRYNYWETYYPYYHRYNYWETYYPYNNYWYYSYKSPHKKHFYNKDINEKKVYTPTSNRTNTSTRNTNIINTPTSNRTNTSTRSTNNVYNTQNRSTNVNNTSTRSTNNSVRTNSNTNIKQNNGRR